MIFKKNWITLRAMFCLLTLLAVLMVSCNQQTNPVYAIFIEKQHLVNPKFPLMVSPIPYSSEVQQTFVSGDNMTLYIILAGVKKVVTFSRYAFYNRETSQEAETSLPANLGPFGPWDDGGTYYFEVGQWPVPNVPDTYEVRVYLGDKIEGSAVFEVVSPP